MLVYLLGNVITQYLCISSVFVLTTGKFNQHLIGIAVGTVPRVVDPILFSPDPDPANDNLKIGLGSYLEIRLYKSLISLGFL